MHRIITLLISRRTAVLLAAALVAPLLYANSASAATVRRIASQPPDIMQLAFLMTDGTVLAQSADEPNLWYRYAPDINGDYSDGTWSSAATLPSGYAPTAFASALLPDGRLVISGGEYNEPGQYDLQLVNLGAIYDPVANTWTSISFPIGWQWIGDSPATVLPTGQFLMGQKLTTYDAFFDPRYMHLQWATVGWTGKADFNAEEGWTLLPNGTVLTADVKDAPNSEIYTPRTQSWSSAGSTIVDLHSPSPYTQCLTYGPAPQDCYYPPGEIGPAMLRPDGSVFATGSGSGANGDGPGHTAIYHTEGSLKGTWTVGPNFPNDDNAGDSYATLLPSGNVLVFGVSGALYEFNGSTFTQTGYSTGVPILLPTGQVLMIGNTDALYTASGGPQQSWRPQIAQYPSSIAPGHTYTVGGTQFNGLSQAMAFGDEYQNATNYPLVRIINAKTRHVFYARTHDHSTMGVATGSKPVSTHFDVPSNIETGAAYLQVVANGIGSPPVSITVSSAR